MPTIEGGQLVARALKAHGVDHLFTLCGGTIESIYDGCLSENIRIIDVRVDHCATMMADAYARVTGRLAASAVTRGPGHAAAFYGLATAHMAGSPVLGISGYSNLAQLDMGGSQEYDLVGTVKPITKWARLVAHTARIPEYVATAARHAVTCRPGPVHLSIPYDVLFDSIEDRGMPALESETIVAAARPQADAELIEQALQALATAQRPAVVAGSAVRWSHAGAALVQFAEATGLPLFADQTGINDITRPHPLYFGRATLRYAAACKELRHADVVLALGCRFDNALNFGRPPLLAADARLIAVDADPTTLGFNRAVTLGIVADVGAALEQLTAASGRHDFSPKNDWLDRLRSAREQFDAKVAEAAHSDATPIHPLRVCAEVREIFGDEATVTHDGGDVAGFALMSSNHHQPPWLLVTGPIGGIGHGVPFVLAGKLARPDHPAVLLTGDGSIGYGIMEFDTALKHNLPFTAVVFSDSAWGIVRHPQIARYGLERAVATDLRTVAYHQVAEALGCHGECVTRPAELRPALQRALRANEQGTPALVNVQTPFLSSSAFAPVAVD